MSALDESFRFDEPGTLPRPGPLGRLIRALFGIGCLSLVWNILFHGDSGDLSSPALWFWVVFGLMLAPYVINIGFGVRWGAWPRWTSLGILMVLAVVSQFVTGDWLNQSLWIGLTVWMVYVYGHLGLSFVISALLATPGCEMRALPHLFGRLAGQEVREHYCPGFIDAVDRWELGGNDSSDDSGDATTRDLLSSPGRMLLLYGLPFVALQLAGNLGGKLIGNGVPALAFLLVGAICLINAVRCRRVHCLILGPWFLIAGVAMTLLTADMIDLGRGSWPLIVNTALAGGFCLGFGSESALGRYLGSSNT